MFDLLLSYTLSQNLNCVSSQEDVGSMMRGAVGVLLAIVRPALSIGTGIKKTLKYSLALGFVLTKFNHTKLSCVLAENGCIVSVSCGPT